MKTLKELRSSIGEKATQQNVRLSSLGKHYNIDYNVFLPTKNINLQRDFVWSLYQKREIIMSILLNRNIPDISVISINDDVNRTTDIWQIIDGKQRLSSMIEFINNKFSIVIDNVEYYINDLPYEYERTISCFSPKFTVIHEEYNKKISDQEKIDWFILINFAGTAQDESHINLLKEI